MRFRALCRCYLPGIAIAVFPLALLFPLAVDYAGDWPTHLWTITHCGESLRAHGFFPEVFHTDEAVGIPWTVFYGPLFYPLLGMAATVFDARVVMKIFLLALFLAQFFLLRRSFRVHGMASAWATGIGALLLWAIYPLTNLYNRGALGEVVGGGYLVCALSCALIAIAPAVDLPRRRFHLLGCWFFNALILGTHPITAIYSTLIYALLIALCLALGRGPEIRSLGWRWMLLGAGLFAIVSSAWLYAAARVGAQLGGASLGQAPTPRSLHLDWWVTRFFPVPFDVRVWNASDLGLVSTPYMDTQISMPLLALSIMLLASAWLAPKPARDKSLARVTAVYGLGLGFFCWISLAAPGIALLPKPFWSIQFVYRTVTTINLALLLGTWALSLLATNRRQIGQNSAVARIWLVGLVAWAGLCVPLKFAHAQHARTVEREFSFLRTAAAETYATKRHGFLYGFAEMTTLNSYPPGADEAGSAAPSVRALFPVGSGKTMGEISSIALDLLSRQWVSTNVQAFVWNTILLDGRPVDKVHLRLGNRDLKQLDVDIPAGRHTLSYRYEPAPGWRILRGLGLAVFALWIIGLGGWFAWNRGKLA